MERRPQTGDFYYHFKNKLYQIKGIAIHSESREELVIYQALYGDYLTYARPLTMFVSEVDHEKYPEVQQKYRFTKVLLQKDGTMLFPEETNGNKLVTECNTVADARQTGASALNSEGLANGLPEQELEEANGVHPGLMSFLDTEDFEEKYNIVVSMRDSITDDLIDAMAASLDTIIPEDTLTKRYDQLKNTIRIRQKYEFANRLR